jgi:hypothetical protein
MPSENDLQRDLSSLLREWQPAIEPTPGFNRNVWAKIQASEGRPRGFLSFLIPAVHRLAGPRIAMAAIALALFGGVLIGGLEARSSNQERYLSSLKLFATQTHVLP